MSIYPFSVWLSDASVGVKLWGVLDVVLCTAITILVYRYHNGRSLISAIRDAPNVITRTATRMNSSNGLPDTASALLNKPSTTADDTYSETMNETTALTSKDNQRTDSIIAEAKLLGQSHNSRVRGHHSEVGRTVKLSGHSNGSAYMNGTYSVTHDGRNLKIVPRSWSKYPEQMMARMGHGTPNINIRHAIFKKLGLEMSAGGTMFVPKAYMDKFRRTTFRGLSFKRIAAIQRKY